MVGHGERMPELILSPQPAILTLIVRADTVCKQLPHPNETQRFGSLTNPFFLQEPHTAYPLSETHPS